MTADQPNLVPPTGPDQRVAPTAEPAPRFEQPDTPAPDPGAAPRTPHGTIPPEAYGTSQPGAAAQGGPSYETPGPGLGPHAMAQPGWAGSGGHALPQPGIFGGTPGGPPPGGMGQGGGRKWSAGRRVGLVAAALALALGAGGAGAAVTMTLQDNDHVYSSPTAVTGASDKAGTTAKVAAAVQPSVVSIQAETGRGTSGGSGVILRSDGVIMTNAHVVAGARQVTVKFSDGRTAKAQVLGGDEKNDIAVIKAAGVSGLKPVTLGNSGALAVGDTVLAVGSPLGLDGSVTSGIVSALGREIREGGQEEELPPYLRERVSQQQTTVIKNAIQTDAAINPGNSGGALVDAAGRLIGVNTAIATGGSGSGNIGVGFAIPVNDAKKIADGIIRSASI
ncbi:trypsin-like peptidase domain-containing protein [Spirillospora sp. CA-294931]|uniref:S1C family serine protease n=1 Tax=Spirillospora sp. CA-294931 TaxID=3240042 RepID=UPI003D904312